MTIDADLFAKGKEHCILSAATECTVMAVLAFKNESDKAKLRTVMQGVVRHLKMVQASFADPQDAVGAPTSILHDCLKKRIAAALKLR